MLGSRKQSRQLRPIWRCEARRHRMPRRCDLWRSSKLIGGDVRFPMPTHKPSIMGRPEKSMLDDCQTRAPLRRCATVFLALNDERLDPAGQNMAAWTRSGGL